MRLYRRDKKFVHFSFSYNKEIVNAVKSIEGRRWNPDLKEWYIPLTIANSSSIKNFIQKYSFKNNDLSHEKVEKVVIPHSIEESVKNGLKSTFMEDLGLKFSPRDYQKFGIAYNLEAGSCISGDDVGLGKTLCSIFTAHKLNKFPVLVICPTSVKYHWFDYFSILDKKVSVVDSGSIPDFDADVVIINYDMLGDKEHYVNTDGKKKWRSKVKFEELLSKKWEVLIIDEIHYIKNKSLRNDIVKKIAKKSSNVYGLSGTLTVDKPADLIQPLTVIGKFNELFGSWKNFVQRYCDAKITQFGWDISGASNLDELNAILRANCYYRREKREVIKDMPDVQESLLNFSISNKKKYDKAEANFIQYVIDNFPKGKIESALAAEYLVLRNELRKLSVEGKLKAIETWLKEWQESTKEKVVVFGIHRTPLLTLAKKFNCDVVNGDISAIEKSQIISDFQTNNKQFLFGNIKSMGTGTDGLQNISSNTLIIELPDTPAEVDQVIGRVDRSGQKNNVNIYFGLSRDTIDIDIWSALEKKKVIATMVNKGKRVDVRGFDEMLIKNIMKKNNK